MISIHTSTKTIFTIYLIRHGEAQHNVMEKSAMTQAQENAIQNGITDPQMIQERIEQARVAVLNDVTLLDCPLTERGCHEAKMARQTIDRLIQSGHPSPTCVYVSPLQRTLQTVNIIFQEVYDNDLASTLSLQAVEIHVCDTLKERQTGLPCDTSIASILLRSRPSFRRFGMCYLMKHSIPNLLITKTVEAYTNNQAGNDVRCERVEDKCMLRIRTRQLLRLLMKNSIQSVVTLVTHKGYLRELERGLFQQPNATEFQNGEIRIYQIAIHTDTYNLVHAKRIL
jgi:phosphohistidine phosphatase SixA